MNDKSNRNTRDKLAIYKCIKPMDCTINAINRLNKIKTERHITDTEIDCLIIDLQTIADFIINNCYGVEKLKKRMKENLKV